MSYGEKVARVKENIIALVLERIESRYNFNKDFHFWSYSAIAEGYVSKFKEEFSQYMNDEINTRLWFAGKNVAFAVQSFIDINPSYTCRSLLRFVEAFVTTQLDDFDNWCDEIATAMPTEEEMMEDNPVIN